MRPRRTIWTAFRLCAAVAFTMLGCGDNPAKPPQEGINSNSPNANPLIRNQRSAGDPAKHSSIYQITDTGDGGFYYFGIQDSHHVVGKLGPDGSSIWTKGRSYGLKDFCRIDATTGGFADALVAVGSFDVDGNGTPDQGKVVLYGSDGTLTSEITFLQPGRRVWLNAVAVSTRSPAAHEYVAFGGVDAPVGSPHYPYLARFRVSSDGTLTKGEEKIFTTLSGPFLNVVPDSGSSGPSYYLSGNKFLNDSTITNAYVLKLSDSLSVDWSADIVADAGFKTNTTASSMGYADGNVYVVGRTEILKQGVAWLSGWVASVSAQGQVRWVRAVGPTQYADHYIGCRAGGGAVWAAGVVSAYQASDTKEAFGYGWLSKIDPSGGNVLANMSFGEKSYASGFNTLIMRGARAYCAGWTRQEVNGGGFQNWFAEVDVANPIAKVQPGETTARDARAESETGTCMSSPGASPSIRR